MIKNKLNGLSSGILLSICISFMLCVYAPYELFLTNQFEFWLDAKVMIVPVLLFFTFASILCIAGLILLRLIGKIPYYIGLAVGFIALIYLYIQGNFLVGGLPEFDGTSIDWNAASPERIKSIIVFVVVAAVVTFVLIKFKTEIFRKVTLVASICVMLLLTVTLSTLFLTTDIVDKSKYLKTTDINEFQFSTDKNFIVLVLDAVDETSFYEAMQEDPEFQEMMNGFTYFDNALAGYPFTMLSMPFIMSGEWYENNESVTDYVSRSVDQSPLIKAAEQQNYKIGIYDYGDLELDAETHAGRYENQLEEENLFKTKRQAIKLMAKLAGIKYAPWDLKRYCYNAADYSQEIKTSSIKEDQTYFDWRNEKFYEKLKTDSITTVSDKCLRIIHLNGAHVPYQYNKDVEVTDNATYKSNIEACVTLSKEFIRNLKEKNIYDNSAIVIMSDHGYNRKDYDKDANNDMRTRAHPLLMVKGFGENREFSVSNAPISYEDVADAFNELINDKQSADAFPYKDGDTRERRFLYYHYEHEDHIEEYKTNGQADDVEAMQSTGNVYDYAE